MNTNDRDNDQLVILDYGYIWKKDPKIMFCHRNNCYGKLQYTENYDMFYCTKCGAKYDIIDFIYRMDISEEAYKENLKYKDMGELVIGIGAPSGFVKYNTTGGHS